MDLTVPMLRLGTRTILAAGSDFFCLEAWTRRLQRLAPWDFHVLLFQIIYTLVFNLNPNTDQARTPARSAGDVPEAAFGAVGEGSDMPRDPHFDGRVVVETSEESRDAEKRALEWRETAKLAGLRDLDTVLGNWR